MEREENIRDNIIKLPKIELHCHLDGSLSREFVEKRLGRTVQEAELSVSDDCTSLAQYLEKFDLPGQCIQDEKGLEGAAYDVLKGMHRENVVYAEIRFAPLLSENERMSCERVIEAALKGLERGKKDFGIEYGLIVCAMRHHSEEQNRRMLHTAREFLGAGQQENTLEMVCARQTLQVLRCLTLCQASWSFSNMQSSSGCLLQSMRESVEMHRIS